MRIVCICSVVRGMIAERDDAMPNRVRNMTEAEERIAIFSRNRKRVRKWQKWQTLVVAICASAILWVLIIVTSLYI